jgi:fucose permease
MSLGVFDTHLSVQGMESIFEHRHCLSLLLPQCGPSHVLFFIVINRVVLFLDRIHKKSPSGLVLIYFRFLYGTFLPVIFPPMFDMGETLEDFEGDIFLVGKIVNREITF